MRGEKLFRFLNDNNIQYEKFKHPLTYSAQMTANVTHIPGKEFAKTVIVKVKGRLVMVVTNANQKVNLRLLKNIYSTEDVELASEREFREIFQDCELGAMPPFGNLYNMEELVSEELTKDDYIVFNAGTHTDLIKMRYDDFEKLVQPRIVNFRISL